MLAWPGAKVIYVSATTIGESPVRILCLLPLALLGACNVQNDTQNDAVTLEYNQQRIEEGVSDAADAAKDIARGVSNVAVTAGHAVRNEVGDIDVDVDVSRNRDQQGNGAN